MKGAEGVPPEKSVSLLKLADAEAEAPLANVLAFLILIMIFEGFDFALFPSVSKALERTVGFDVNIVGRMATLELFVKAAFGPFWGVMCVRGTLHRRTILCFCSFLQGLATLIMCFFINNETPNIMYLLRCLNGIALAGLKPIAFSIVADRFDDTVRGRYFALMNMAFNLGNTIIGGVYGYTSEWCTADPQRFEQCPLPSEECDAEPVPCTCGGFLGWQLAFILTGLAVMLFAPMVHCFLKVPAVTVKPVATESAGENAFVREIKGLWGLLRRPTFAILVLQGCFGSIPGNAFQFRGYFFETAGLTKGETQLVLTAVGFVGIFGGAFSGWLSDFLNKKWPFHGRVLNAEISVYGGIPFALFTFASAFAPARENAFAYYATLSILLHLISGGVQGGTNAPILSALAEPEERALVVSWQIGLESSFASLGPVIFTELNKYFGYDPDCENPCPAHRPDTCGPPEQNREAAGMSLLFCSVVPWAICGLMYSSLHYFLPRDMERAFQERRQRSGGATVTQEGLTTELVA